MPCLDSRCAIAVLTLNKQISSQCKHMRRRLGSLLIRAVERTVQRHAQHVSNVDVTITHAPPNYVLKAVIVTSAGLITVGSAQVIPVSTRPRSAMTNQASQSRATA